MPVLQTWLLTLVHVPEFTPHLKTGFDLRQWCTPNPSTLELEAGESGGQPLVSSKLEAIMGYKKPCLKNKVRLL